MPARLTQPLDAYFAASSPHDVAAMLAPFAEGAVVKAEGKPVVTSLVSGNFPGSPASTLDRNEIVRVEIG